MQHPMPKARELAERLARIATADVVDKYALGQVQADAEGLMRTNAAGAHAALAMVAALRWDVEELRRQHGAAVGLRDSAHPCGDYSAAFTMVGEIDEAYQVACDALARTPDDLTALHRAIEAAVQNGRFHDARALCERWSRRSSNGEMPLRADIEELVEAVEQGGFTEFGAREVLRTASALRRDARIRCKGFSIRPSIEDPGTFGFTYDVIASTADTGDLNYALAERWVDSPGLQTDPGLAFVPIFIGRIGNGRHA